MPLFSTVTIPAGAVETVIGNPITFDNLVVGGVYMFFARAVYLNNTGTTSVSFGIRVTSGANTTRQLGRHAPEVDSEVNLFGSITTGVNSITIQRIGETVINSTTVGKLDSSNLQVTILRVG